MTEPEQISGDHKTDPSIRLDALPPHEAIAAAGNYCRAVPWIIGGEAFLAAAFWS